MQFYNKKCEKLFIQYRVLGFNLLDMSLLPDNLKCFLFLLSKTLLNVSTIGWSYAEVLPFFKISEDNRDHYFAKDTEHHAVGGPQPVQVPRFYTPVGPAFLVRNSIGMFDHHFCHLLLHIHQLWGSVYFKMDKTIAEAGFEPKTVYLQDNNRPFITQSWNIQHKWKFHCTYGSSPLSSLLGLDLTKLKPKKLDGRVTDIHLNCSIRTNPNDNF